ncbi:hypothetical protein GH733_002962 [Mirounga leonina]|nr:hypothetical protein GH733_002962 [Mirounga leonina]
MCFTPATPRGASGGVFEASEPCDNDKIQYTGKGVSKAVEHITEVIGPAPSNRTLNSRTSGKPCALEWRCATTSKNIIREKEAVTNEGNEESLIPNILEIKEASEPLE